ncbi:MAG TPA: rhodanese-like domain-containing protein [Stellaceae bacterium]|jgi:rhodanese-related sulfurtransferase
MPETTNRIDVPTLRLWLADGGEVALVDLREEGEHNGGHPLLAVSLPYSRMELDIARLVPRRACRLVVIDGGDGVADRAARRLAGLGFAGVSVLTGGVAAWEAAGYPLFPSSNVPSKAFAESVEIDSHTPHVTAAELAELQRNGTKLKILDSRTVEEFNRFHVPGAQTCPGAELVYRFADLVPDEDTLVVVSCAGRTRSIIGAQSLINAGVPNKVVSLQGGTQGWRLAGLELERNTTAAVSPVSAAGASASNPRAEAVAARYGVKRIGHATLAAWRAETGRTTHLLDVRTPDEFAAGHLPGSDSAPGGQLVQAIDRWVATRGSRLVLIDDGMTRAIMTAHWLIQLGWDVVVLDRPLEGQRLETGAIVLPEVASVPTIDAAMAAREITGGAAAVVLGASAAYRRAHPAGAVWSIRPRLDRLPASVLKARRIVVFGEDPVIARLAAAELAEISRAAVTLVSGGIAAWQAAGLPVVATPDDPPDSERIDFIFWNHDRHDGNAGAMRAYLQWELDLPGEVARDGLSGFRVAS